MSQKESEIAEPGDEDSAPRVPSTPVLVTGATSGIGRALALSLARKHVPLIVHGRNPELLNGLVAELKQLSGDTLLESVSADLASQAEIKDLASKIKSRHKSLHAVVNNAGVIMGARVLSDEGVEITLAVNHVAPFLITELLQDELADGDGGRVVNVNSFLHKRGSVDLENLNAQNFFRPVLTYSSAKLLSLMTTLAWSRRLRKRNITVNAYNPGMVRTKMIGGTAVRIISPLFAKSPKTAASTAAFLAISPKVAGLTGGYYAATGGQKKPSDASQDEAVQESVFVATEKLIRV
jgi:NAD(P)-dependent dehydrogenase (short-subunit alcohol dehydrogenase family)